MSKVFKEKPLTILENKSKRNGFRSAIYGLNGHLYIGEWKDDKKHGKGVQKWLSTGLSYSGDWVFGRRCGHGILSQQINNRNTRVYVGYWENDKRNGFGVNFYQDGGVYEGHWFKGSRDSTGKMLYSDESVYHGQWKMDKRHGFGNIKNDGDYFEGFWENDCLVIN